MFKTAPKTRAYVFDFLPVLWMLYTIQRGMGAGLKLIRYGFRVELRANGGMLVEVFTCFMAVVLCVCGHEADNAEHSE
jgi:hypothetical protein